MAPLKCATCKYALLKTYSAFLCVYRGPHRVGYVSKIRPKKQSICEDGPSSRLHHQLATGHPPTWMSQSDPFACSERRDTTRRTREKEPDVRRTSERKAADFIGSEGDETRRCEARAGGAFKTKTFARCKDGFERSREARTKVGSRRSYSNGQDREESRESCRSFFPTALFSICKRPIPTRKQIQSISCLSASSKFEIPDLDQIGAARRGRRQRFSRLQVFRRVSDRCNCFES